MITQKKTIAGKVGSKKKLHEADGNYTPEEIDEFVVKATKDVEDLKKVFTAFKDRVEKLSIASMLANPGEAESLDEKLKKASAFAKQKYEYYFDIVEPYGWVGSPKNVKQLDTLTQKLDYLQENLGYIKYAMDSMVEAAKDFNKFYSIEDEDS